jgi:hypothetical protein
MRSARGAIMKKYLLCVAIGCAFDATAAQYCVNNSAGLVSALTSAAASAEADEVRFTQGSITINTDIVPSQINGALSLRGGYLAGCAERASNASKTLLHGSGRKFHLFLNDHDLLLERMDFIGQSLVSVGGNIANPLISMILVTRSRFLNTRLWIESYSHDVRVENSLFITGGLRIDGFYTPVTQRYGQLSVVNCTAYGGDNGITIKQSPAEVSTPLKVPMLLNNISFGNAISDLNLRTPTLVSYNIYGTVGFAGNGGLTAQSQQNLQQDPLLDSNYRPTFGSPAIDSGTNVAFPSGPIAQARDYSGNARLVGSHIDRGASEVPAWISQ